MTSTPEDPPAATCPRCGIDHHDQPERARRNTLCVDCRELDGPGWAQRARRETARLYRAEGFTPIRG